MPIYTVISEVTDDMQVTQHEVEFPENAVCDHIAVRGLDPLYEFSDEEIEQLRNIARNPNELKLIPISHCSNTWLWTSNTEHSSFPQPLTIYVVQTDTSANKILQK